ncbi:MAG: TIR domain-containing protein [Pseudomonadota bacterium]
MLVEIEAVCPSCQKAGPIRVSSDANRTTGTFCASCNVVIITMTQDDGHVLLFAGENAEKTGLAFLHPKIGDAGPDGGFAVILPPERFGLRNADYGKPPKPHGLSDAEFNAQMIALMGPDMLFRPDGSARPERDIVRKIGFRGLWVTQLGHEIQQRVCGVPAMTFPPKIFLSYRWQDEARNAWVADLAAELQARGYAVMFDRDLPQTDDPNVPQIVSRVAECRYFLAIVDPGYLARIGSGLRMEDGWVYDEHQTALSFSNAGLVRVLGFLREGDGGGESFKTATPGRMGNLLDVRTPERLASILNQIFPRLDTKLEPAAAEEARAAICLSHEAFVRGDIEQAVLAAQTAAGALPQSPDGALQLIRIAHHAGIPRLGLAAAKEALQHHPSNIELLIEAASFAVAAGAPKAAAEFAARALEQDIREQTVLAEAHGAMGWALDEMDRVDAALGHARSAVRLNPEHPTMRTNLGYIQRRLGDPAAAVETFRDGHKRFPDDLLLLENFAGALVEAGQWDDAEVIIMRLHQKGGRDEVVGALARAVMRGRETGEVPNPSKGAVPDFGPDRMSCEACGTSVGCTADQREFCAGCGTPGGGSGTSCGYCGYEGWMTAFTREDPANARCPFCRNGALSMIRHGQDISLSSHG